MRDYVDYVTLHSVMNIMAENSDKMKEHRAIIVFSYQYPVPVRKDLLETHHDRCCSLVKYLCLIFAVSTYSNTVMS